MYALLLWVGISNCLSEPSHGHLSAHELDFGTTPDIRQFMHHIFWYPVYYYYTEEKFPSTKEKSGCCFGPTQHYGDDLTYRILTEKKLTYPSPLYDRRMILALWLVTGSCLFVMRGWGGAGVQAWDWWYQSQVRWYPYQCPRHHSVCWDPICWSIGPPGIHIFTW